jgi:hypothetical protein
MVLNLLGHIIIGVTLLTAHVAASAYEGSMKSWKLQLRAGDTMVWREVSRGYALAERHVVSVCEYTLVIDSVFPDRMRLRLWSWSQEAARQCPDDHEDVATGLRSGYAIHGPGDTFDLVLDHTGQIIESICTGLGAFSQVTRKRQQVDEHDFKCRIAMIAQHDLHWIFPEQLRSHGSLADTVIVDTTMQINTMATYRADNPKGPILVADTIRFHTVTTVTRSRPTMISVDQTKRTLPGSTEMFAMISTHLNVDAETGLITSLHESVLPTTDEVLFQPGRKHVRDVHLTTFKRRSPPSP